MNILKIGTILSVLLLSGCFEDVEKNVGWYMDNAEQREQKIIECKKNSSLMITKECVNAFEADRKALNESFTTRKQTPLVYP